MASTPVWPKYVPQAKDRMLWCQRADGSWCNEHGEIAEARSAAEVCALLFTSNGQAFCGSVELLPCFAEAVARVDKAAVVRGLADGSLRPESADAFWVDISVHPDTLSPIGLAFHRKWPDSRGHMREQVRKVTAATAWGVACGPEMLSRLRWLFDTLGCGVHATPGATGAAVMAGEWGKHKAERWPRHHRPPLPLVELLSRHAVGSRKETYDASSVFTHAWEADMTNGFAAQADYLPSGTVASYPGTMAHHYLLPLVGNVEAQRTARIKHWWGRCYVRLWGDLPLGDVAPFAVRDEETNELTWPTRDGGYWVYLWGFEADEIQQRYQTDGSMQILAIEWAWTWETETTQLAGWAEHMDGLRRATQYGTLSATNDAIERKERANLIKLCIVAGIGRLGLPYETMTVLPEAEADEWRGDVPLQSEKMPETGLYVRKQFCDMGTPAHWHKFILSKMNFAIYQKIREQYKAGVRVLGCNVDGVQTLERPVGVVEPSAARMGEYKAKEYQHYFAMPAPGTILTPQDMRTPGLRADMRRSIAAGRWERSGERRQPHSRGEILAEQGRRLWLDEMHHLSKTAVARLQKEIDGCENVRQWYLRGRSG